MQSSFPVPVAITFHGLISEIILDIARRISELQDQEMARIYPGYQSGDCLSLQLDTTDQGVQRIVELLEPIRRQDGVNIVADRWDPPKAGTIQGQPMARSIFS